jgi:DNA-binding transcriptional ArsR family regulator
MSAPDPVQGAPLDDAPRSLAQAIGEAFTRLPDRPEVPDQEPEGESFDQVPRKARADKQLSATGYRVLAAIEGGCFGSSRRCSLTNGKLGANAGGISHNTVRRALRELEELGYLRVELDKTRFRGQVLVLLYELKGPWSG